MAKDQDKDRSGEAKRPAEQQGIDAPPPRSFSGDARTPGARELARDGDTIVHPGTASSELGRPSDPGGRLAGSPEEPAREIERTALDGAPGIPAAEGKNLDAALETPDSDLGGVVAADTTPGGETGDKPSREQVRREDKDRTTL
ncbi:MAG TPA: hypothetical protein VK911_06415 [Vicinamibacterales bacterium]|nr:hypothetical protein [Vicinamibacterales bacterium]